LDNPDTPSEDFHNGYLNALSDIYKSIIEHSNKLKTDYKDYFEFMEKEKEIYNTTNETPEEES
jgi:hypothetical protein